MSGLLPLLYAGTKVLTCRSRHMRVIAGTFRRRPLRSLRGLDIRPTSDRLRETLFNVLCAGDPAALRGTVWLDLFAGTGAVGIEALSRGAAQVTFVESARDAAAIIEQNLRALAISGGAHILRVDVKAALRKIGADGRTADIVFLDPPYRFQNAYRETLEALDGSSLVTGSTTVIAEHDRKFEPGAAFGGLRRYRKLEQGDSALSFYKRVDGVET
jgi:16S rRNA (guanine(966)-N(2))-methyltransferase RsmD